CCDKLPRIWGKLAASRSPERPFRALLVGASDDLVPVESPIPTSQKAPSESAAPGSVDRAAVAKKILSLPRLSRPFVPDGDVRRPDPFPGVGVNRAAASVARGADARALAPRTATAVLDRMPERFNPGTLSAPPRGNPRRFDPDDLPEYRPRRRAPILRF